MTILGLPWWGIVGIACGAISTLLLIWGVFVACHYADEDMSHEQLPCPRFTSWEVDESDLIFEEIVHRPVTGTVLVHD